MKRKLLVPLGLLCTMIYPVTSFAMREKQFFYDSKKLSCLNSQGQTGYNALDPKLFAADPGAVSKEGELIILNRDGECVDFSNEIILERVPFSVRRLVLTKWNLKGASFAKTDINSVDIDEAELAGVDFRTIQPLRSSSVISGFADRKTRMYSRAACLGVIEGDRTLHHCTFHDSVGEPAKMVIPESAAAIWEEASPLFIAFNGPDKIRRVTRKGSVRISGPTRDISWGKMTLAEAHEKIKHEFCSAKIRGHLSFRSISAAGIGLKYLWEFPEIHTAEATSYVNFGYRISNNMLRYSEVYCDGYQAIDDRNDEIFKKVPIPIPVLKKEDDVFVNSVRRSFGGEVDTVLSFKVLGKIIRKKAKARFLIEEPGTPSERLHETMSPQALRDKYCAPVELTATRKMTISFSTMAGDGSKPSTEKNVKLYDGFGLESDENLISNSLWVYLGKYEGVGSRQGPWLITCPSGK